MKTSPRSLAARLLLVPAVLLLAAFFGGGAAAAEYYASDQDSEASLGTGRVAGTGSQSSPWRGDFDAILRALPERATLNLDGVYFTRGTEGGQGVRLRQGQSLLGSGRLTTTVRLRLVATQRAEAVVLHGAEGASDITVSDLTVDAGAESPRPDAYVSKRNGVNLLGSRCTIRNVRAIRCFGRINRSKECFAIKCFGGSDNLIEGCEVSDVRGDYCSAIGLRSGEIRNNVVIFPQVAPDGPEARVYWHGYNCEEATNVWVHHNQSFNGTSGYYVDTGFTHNLRITDNQFNSVRHGVYINMIVDTHQREAPRGVDGCSITNNRIFLDPAARTVVGVLLDHTTVEYNACDVFENFIQHVRITHNEIGYAPGVPPPSLGRGGKLAVSIASNAPYRPGTPDRLPVGISDVVVEENVIQDQPPGTGEFGFRNKILSKCTGVEAPNADQVRGKHRSAGRQRSIQWQP